MGVKQAVFSLMILSAVVCASPAMARNTDITKNGVRQGDLVQMLGDHNTLINAFSVNSSRMRNAVLLSGTVREIGATVSVSAEVTTTECILIGGAEVVLAPLAALPTPSGTITSGNYNTFLWFVDSSGTLSVSMGTEAATRAAHTFPVIPFGKAVVGGVTLNPTGGAFTGGSTRLGGTSNPVFFSPTAFFDPAATYTPTSSITISTSGT